MDKIIILFVVWIALMTYVFAGFLISVFNPVPSFNADRSEECNYCYIKNNVQCVFWGWIPVVGDYCSTDYCDKFCPAGKVMPE